MSPSSYADVKRIIRKAEKAERQLEMAVVEITPEIAVELLQHNNNIRRIRESVVTRYTTDMLLDGWMLTGQPLIFDDEGDLKNGQHTLTSCIRADRPFTTVVVMGVEASVDISMDVGAKRTLADYLGTHEFADAKNLAAAIRLSYQLIEEEKVTQSAVYTNEMLTRWFTSHKSLVEDLERVRLWERDWPKGFTRSHAAAIRHAAGFVPNLDIEDVDSFFAQLALAEESINPKSPALLLHRIFSRSSGQTRSRGRDRIQLPERIALTIKAINYYVWGRDIPSSGLGWRQGGAHPERFPQLSAGVVAEIAAEVEAEVVDG